MKHLTSGAAIAGVLALGSIGFAAAAEAAPLGGSTADVAINGLKARGYDVQLNLNSSRDVPLSECIVSGVHGLPTDAPVGAPAPTAQLTTVYVDVVCPPDN